MGTQLYRSEGPACMADGGMIIGGCPTASGKGIIQTSFNISQSAPFAELMVTIQIIGSNNQSIVCVAVLLEQSMPQVSTTVSFLPLVLAALSGGISLTATIMRASVGNGFLGAVATYGLPTEAILVHTPGFFDIVFYTQFMVMTGQLSVNYPSFYSTFTALFHWSFLEFANTLIEKGPANATDVLMYGGSGSVNQIKGSQYIGGNRTNSGNGTQLWSHAKDYGLRKRELSPLEGPEISWLELEDFTPAVGTRRAAVVLTTTVVLTSTAYIPSPTLAPLGKRQFALPDISSTIVTSASPTTDTVSPTSSSSSTTTVSSTPTTTSFSSSSSSSDSSSSSSSRSKPSSSGARPAPPVSRTPPQRLPTSSTTASLVIPTITDPFTNTSGVSIQYNVSRFGLEAYAAAIGAFPSSLFLGTLINTALAAAASLLVSAALLGVAWIMAKENHQRGKTLYHARNFVAGNLLRMWLLLYTPLALSAMYQLTLSENVGLTVASAACLLIVSVGATIFYTWRILRASSELLLYDDQATLLKYGTLYNTLAQEGTLFFLMTLLVRFLWGLAISMLSSFGIAQVAVLMVVEFGYVLVIGVKWPYSESGDNKFHLFLGIIRIVITGCSIAYIHELEASPDLRQLFAYIQMALHLAVFIVIFALVLWNFIQVCMFSRGRHSDSWRGPTKTYNFDDPMEGSEHGWGLAGRPLSRGGGPGGVHTRGIVSHRHEGEDEEGDEFGPAKDRRFTVISYSSLGSSSHGGTGGRGPRRLSMQHALHAPPTSLSHHPMALHDSLDDDTLRYASPAERYRQTRLMDHGRSPFAPSTASEGGSMAEEAILDRRIDSRIPLAAGTAIAATSSSVNAAGRSSSPSPSRPHSQDPSTDVDESTKIVGIQSYPAGMRGRLPQRESYANLQRMSHQQSDPRARRMSDITRDGPYLYDARKEMQEAKLASSPLVPLADTSSHLPKEGILTGLVASLGAAFRFGRRRGGSSKPGDGSKPKAFEVMRPPRRHYASDEPTLTGSAVEENGSQAGGDQLRELNSLGISRFFQESDRGYERNRSLFVANPSAMISRTGSLVSTTSGAVGPNSTTAAAAATAANANARLNRNGSGTAVSVRTLNYARSRGAGMGSGLGPGSPHAGVSVGGGDRSSMAASGIGGADSSAVSEHGGTRAGTASISDKDSRRASFAAIGTTGPGAGSMTGSQLYAPRHSADSTNNIAEALTIDAPLLLQGGGILRVSKGPEKAVQYWHKETGQYVESIAESLKDEKLEARAREAAVPAAAFSNTTSRPPAPSTVAVTREGGVELEPVTLAAPSLILPTIHTQVQQQGQPLREEEILLPSVASRSMAGSSIVSVGLSGSVPTTGSSPDSPAESQESPTTANVAASAGRMHEILGRMFSDRSVRLHSDQEQDSDSVLSEGDSASTFSGRMSVAQQAQPASLSPLVYADANHPGVRMVATGQRLSEDTHSIECYDMLEPVAEDSDMEQEPAEQKQQQKRQQQRRDVDLMSASPVNDGNASSVPLDSPQSSTEEAQQADPISPNLLKRSSSASEKSRSNASLVRTFSGPSQPQARLAVSKHNSISKRPLAQTPLHSPSVQLASGSNTGSGGGMSLISTSTAAGLPTGCLSRQSSIQSGTSASIRMDYLDTHWIDHSTNHSQSSHDDLMECNYLNRNASIGTARTEASYKTAMSQYSSDEEDNL
ncbi:hypothetical protein EDD11_000391 [Mortierella claussenii]|nr:hypothetical protein EDD11_000391 [Mortierella claussenii]